ncbi:MAG: hypothetical protein DIZ80_16185 [endosymbiont of Galathealinum brachiosum]|uniref:Cyclic nucleotide-binding protein n=1 Tax=endosymbiont of Galathealinum brachiosum TaxID=2200906 RepID=A0A370D9P8_9GAMM|nr:MAG: hypothetical protein DIZ80_16185 [endosymbiont of Galathealinum brachiosum]
MISTEYKKDYPLDSLIFSDGDPADCAYIIEKGMVEVSIIKDEKKLIIALLTDGDLLGEMALIDDHVRNATAIAIEDSQLIVIPREYIKHKIDISDPTVRFFLQVIMERYRDMHARMMHVVEGITHHASEDEYQSMFNNTTNIVKSLMKQYIEMQDRIMGAVNTSTHSDENHVAHPDEVMSTVSTLNLEHNLRNAIENNEFELYYQPIIDIKNNHIAGCEALIRWNNPVLGFVSPADFIPKAEECGLIVPLGQWIIEEACEALIRFLKTSGSKGSFLYVSINLSARQFEHPDLIKDISNVLNNLKIVPANVKFEITETLLMANPDRALEALKNLKQLGVTLAIDDFGTGYSSFSYLHHFPIDTLKIDQTFVGTMCEDKKSFEIVSTLNSLAHNLGMNVIAEGIETADVDNKLRQINSDYAQGYLYSRPVAEAEFIKLLKNGLSQVVLDEIEINPSKTGCK